MPSSYYVTDGKKYLRYNKSGVYYLVNENDATMWTTYKKALNAKNNGISRSSRAKFYVEKAGGSNLKAELNALIEADISDFGKWLYSIGDFERFMSTPDEINSGLTTELSIVDSELCDIRHYIEFGRLNAYRGWAACEMMRLSLIQRRKIKDAMYIIANLKKEERGRFGM